jgi:hypothetical protein
MGANMPENRRKIATFCRANFANRNDLPKNSGAGARSLVLFGTVRYCMVLYCSVGVTFRFRNVPGTFLERVTNALRWVDEHSVMSFEVGTYRDVQTSWLRVSRNWSPISDKEVFSFFGKMRAGSRQQVPVIFGSLPIWGELRPQNDHEVPRLVLSVRKAYRFSLLVKGSFFNQCKYKTFCLIYQ